MRVFVNLILLASCAVHVSAANANATAKEVGAIVASDVKKTIATDAAGVIKAFSSTLPPEVLSLVDSALNITVLQNLSGVTNATQLDSLSAMVSQKMAEIQQTVHTGFTNSSFYGVDQGANFSDLRQCLAQVVSQAAVGATTSGQRCLTMNNTAAVSDVKQIFKNMVDQYAFQLPMQTALDLQKKVESQLANSSLIPPAQDLIKDVQAATLSVAATTNGEYVQALYAAEACFFEALSQPVYSKAFEYQCNAGTVDDNDSTLDNVGDIYRATVNQYAGVLPPEIVENIQAIGDSYLPTNTSKADKQTRDDVNAAILSVVASTSGNTATLTYQLLDCLDLVLIPGAGNQTTQEACINSPTGVAASRLNIINGYIQQFFGVLPPKLVLNMKDKVLPGLANDTSLTAEKAKKHLDDLFTASGAGPAYVTCYQTFEGCVINALGNATAAAQCSLGPACTSLPFQLTLVDTTSPYKAAVSAIDKAQKTGGTKEKQRVSAYAAAAKAAKTQARTVKVQIKPQVAKKVPKTIGKAKKLKNTSKKEAAAVKKPAAKKPKTKAAAKSDSKKSGSLRAQQKTKQAAAAAAKSQAKTSSLQANKKQAAKNKSKSSHLHFSHKDGMHRTPSHKTAVKKAHRALVRSDF